MKTEHAGFYALIFTGSWLTLSFAYIFGTLITSPTLSGLLRIDDLIVASSGVVCFIVAFAIPIFASLSYFATKFLDQGEKWGSISKLSIPISILIASISVASYAAAIERGYALSWIHLLLVIGFGASVPLLIGSRFDRFHSGYFGRAAAIFVASCVMSFLMGSLQPYQLPQSQRRCAAVFKGNELVYTGIIVISAEAGVFARSRDSSEAVFISKDAFDRILVSDCK